MKKFVFILLALSLCLASCDKIEGLFGKASNDVYQQVPEAGQKDESFLVGYVDLGLPSKVKWATANIGALSPEQRGAVFSWNNIPVAENTLQVPSVKDYDELVESAQWTFTSRDGVDGYIISKKDTQESLAELNDENSLFIPVGNLWTCSSASSDKSFLFSVNPPDAGGVAVDEARLALQNAVRMVDYSEVSIDDNFVVSTCEVSDLGVDFSRLHGKIEFPDAYSDFPGKEDLTVFFLLSEQEVITPDDLRIDATLDDDYTFIGEAPSLKENTQYYYVAIALINGIEYRGETKPFKTKRIVDDGNEGVDLGLSVIWASCNLGANSPEECGDYYAWGETETKSTYNSSNYSFYADIAFSSDYNLTKYCGRFGYGDIIKNSSGEKINRYTDAYLELQNDDDVASLLLKDLWRMPTDEEMLELADENNCLWEWKSTDDGVEGYLITSKIAGYTSNSIFLPITNGYLSGSSHNSNSYNFYWTSSFKCEYPYSGYCLRFNQSNISQTVLSRYSGVAIRPVYGERKLKPIVTADEIVINKTSLFLQNGKKESLTYSMSPSNITNNAVEWISQDSSIATVDQLGIVTAVSVGNTQILAKAKYGDAIAACDVSVYIKATSVRLNKSRLNLTLGLSEQLVATIEPTDATHKDLVWTSEDPSVASVDENGRVTAHKIGVTVVSAENQEGLKGTCEIIVGALISGLSLDKETLNIKVGEQYHFSPIVMPSESSTVLNWSSSDSQIVKISEDGTITGINPGKVEIKVESPDKQYYATCLVTVISELQEGMYFEVESIIKDGYLEIAQRNYGVLSTGVEYDIDTKSTVSIPTRLTGVLSTNKGNKYFSVVGVNGGADQVKMTSSNNISTRIKIKPYFSSTSFGELTIMASGVEKLSINDTQLGSYKFSDIQYEGGDVGPLVLDEEKSTSECHVYSFTVYYTAVAYECVSRRSVTFKVPTTVEALYYPVAEVVLDKSCVELSAGSQTSIKSTVLPSNARQTVLWTSSNPQVATVKLEPNGGVFINAHEPGEALITCRSGEDNSKFATCSVLVE